MILAHLMVTCREREEQRAASLRSLAASDWQQPTALIHDKGNGLPSILRIRANWLQALEIAAEWKADAILLTEDDVRFGFHFRHNLENWRPLGVAIDHGAEPGQGSRRDHFFGSLYNPGFDRGVGDQAGRYFVAGRVDRIWGAQAVVMTRPTVQYVLRFWNADDGGGNPDERMPRLASKRTEILYHSPSLVDHAPSESTWGGQPHHACDFDPEWRA